MTRALWAPQSFATWVLAMASAVLLEPVPAITGTRSADHSTAKRTTASCSSAVSVALSPVVPLLFFWLARIWLLARRGELTEDPVTFATQDVPSYAIGVLVVAVGVFAATAPG